MIDENVSQIIELIKCPYEVLELKEDDTDEILMNAYLKNRKRGQKEGYTPVLLDVDDRLVNRIKQFYDYGYDPVEVCEQDLCLQDGIDYLESHLFGYYTFETLLKKEMLERRPKKRMRCCTAFCGETITKILVKLPTTKPYEILMR